MWPVASSENPLPWPPGEHLVEHVFLEPTVAFEDTARSVVAKHLPVDLACRTFTPARPSPLASWNRTSKSFGPVSAAALRLLDPPG